MKPGDAYTMGQSGAVAFDTQNAVGAPGAPDGGGAWALPTPAAADAAAAPAPWPSSSASNERTSAATCGGKLALTSDPCSASSIFKLASVSDGGNGPPTNAGCSAAPAVGPHPTPVVTPATAATAWWPTCTTATLSCSFSACSAATCA
jgi:hypothetical protein